MLTTKELNILLNILNDQDKSLESVNNAFLSAFPRQDHFKFGCGMCILIRDRLLTLQQRFHALYVLYTLYYDKQTDTPNLASNSFVHVFVELLQKDRDPFERYFIILLLTSPIKEIMKKNPKDILSAFEAGQVPQNTNIDINGLRKLFQNRQSNAPIFRKTGVNPVIADPEEPPALIPSPTPTSPTSPTSNTAFQSVNVQTALDLAATEQQQQTTLEQDKLEDEQLSILSFEAHFIRPAPPLFEPKEDEVIWLNPDTIPELLWDQSMCADTSRTEVRELMAKAFKSPLIPSQQQQILAELEADPKLVYHCGLTPKRLPELVENNPLIAIEALLKLMSSNQITDYFSVLVNMERVYIQWK